MNYTENFLDISNQVINVDKDTFLHKSLCTSYFPKELPPIFSTEKFGNIIEKQIKTNKLQGSKANEGTGYYITKNNNSQRRLSIPHPLAYSNVCKIIYENWKEIKCCMTKNWRCQKISMIRPRNSAASKRLVPMEYNTKTKDDLLAKLEILGNGKYIVKTDISMAFPSIYSHSVAWAIKGKEIAQKERNIEDWINRLDRAIRYMSNNESIGIPVSPDISNIIFDLVISCIDKKLINQGFKYVRYIDDFFCVCETKEEAEKFILILTKELNEFRLRINDKKTQMIETPHPMDDLWVRELRKIKMPKIIDDDSYKEIIGFLDDAVTIFKRENNASVLKFAIKVIRNISIKSKKSFCSIEQYLHHLICLYPYTIQDIDIFYETNVEYLYTSNLKILLKTIISAENNETKSDVLTWAFYIALKYKVRIPNIDVQFINDAVSLIMAFTYYKLMGQNEICNNIVERAKGRTEWLLKYSLLNSEDLTEDEFLRFLKNQNISFINKEKLKGIKRQWRKWRLP